MKIVLSCIFFLLCFSVYSLIGDVDNNNSINIIDALKIAQYSVNIIPSPFNKTAADVNVDGIINIVDALLVAQYSTDLITYFPSSTYKRLPVPILVQNTDMCGAACGMMYLLYKKNVYGTTGLIIPSQTDIYNSMRASDPPEGGLPGVTYIGLYKVLNSLLYKYTWIESQSYTRPYILSNTTATDTTSVLAQLTLINAYEPSIVLWRSEIGGHFVVMVGYDENRNEILYNEPDDGSFQSMKLAKWLENEFDPVSKSRTFVAKSM